MVLLPEALRPVNQRVAPLAPRAVQRSSRDTLPSCQVMLVLFVAIAVSRKGGEGECQPSTTKCRG